VPADFPKVWRTAKCVEIGSKNPFTRSVRRGTCPGALDVPLYRQRTNANPITPLDPGMRFCLRPLQTKAMTAEYEITKADLCAFNLYHHRHSPTARRQYLRSWFIPAFAWLLVCIGIWYLADRERGTPSRTLLDLLPLFSIVPLYLLYFPWVYRRKLRKIVDGMVSEGKNRGLFSHHRVTISPEGVTDSGEHNQTATAWRAVERVAAAGEHAYIYTSALSAIIVPRRAFASPSEFEAFVQTAREYQGAGVV